MSAHAVLSASGSSRWLMCTPSARLEEGFPDTAGMAAQEGSLAHNIGDLLVRNKAGRISDKALADCLVNLQKDPLYFPEMLELVEGYAQYVIDEWTAAKVRTSDAILDVEVKLDLTDYIPEGFGTGDAVIVADGVMRIIDLKFGKGVPVNCKENKQMMLYALGALSAYDVLYDIKRVEMTVYQPRLENISTWGIDVPQLKYWGTEWLKPRAEMAFNGEGEFLPGDHCRFCKAKNRCRALADYNLELAKYNFASVETLTDDEIVDILSRTSSFVNWINGINDYAYSEALNGKQWPGYKLVAGRSNRAFTSPDEVASVLITEGYEEDKLYNKKLIGITDMEKLIGKKLFSSLLSPYVVKPEGKPVLAPEDDKRPALNTADRAAEAFANVGELED